MAEHEAPNVFKKRTLLNKDTRYGDMPTEWIRDIASRTLIKGFEPCWIWIGPVTSKGYPYFRMNDYHTGQRHSINVRQHIARLFWDYPDGCHVHNVCNTLNCVNPSHMYIKLGWKS